MSSLLLLPIVDIFIYGLNEPQGIQKMESIETCVSDDRNPFTRLPQVGIPELATCRIANPMRCRNPRWIPEAPTLLILFPLRNFLALYLLRKPYRS